MSNRVKTLIVILVFAVVTGLIYNNATKSGKNAADKQLCLSTQGLRGRYIANIDCLPYDGNDYNGYAH